MASQANSKEKKQPKANPRKLSHTLSWALRHAAPDLGLTMTPDGYVPVDELLHHKHSKLRNIKEEDIRSVVETNDKQRFKLEQRPAVDYGRSEPATILCIRANQGHTVPGIDPNLLLTRLEPDELEAIPTIVHGTYREPYKSIRVQGLKRMARHHIHCASGMPRDDGVISGMRKSCDVYVFIDAAKCARDGIVFYRSDNGVLLTAGVNEEGTLSMDYVSHVIDKSGKILMDNRQAI